MLVAAFLAVVLLAYSGWLGLRYLDASSRVDSLDNQYFKIRSNVRHIEQSRSVQEEDMQTQQQRLESLQALFDHPQADILMTIASDLARDNNLDVESMGVGKLAPEEIENEATYQILPMDIILKGRAPDIYRFLARLNERVPVASISDIRMGNLGVDGLAPTAQVSLLFYLFPEPYSEEE